MGCHFEIQIQVLHGQHWIKIATFYTRTRCGGYPLSNAPPDFAQIQGVMGNYGLELECLKARYDPIAAILSHELIGLENKVSLPTGGSFETVEENDSEIERNSLFYSKDQFAELIKLIENVSEDETLANVHQLLMTPLLLWCEMALTSAPLLARPDEDFPIIELTEIRSEIDDITNRFLEGQQKLLNDQRLRSQQKSSSTSEDAVPIRGSDVRVSWCDEEGQSGALRAGKLNEVQHSEGWSCAIM